MRLTQSIDNPHFQIEQMPELELCNYSLVLFERNCPGSTFALINPLVVPFVARKPESIPVQRHS